MTTDNLPVVAETGIPERYGSQEFRETRTKFARALDITGDTLRIMPTAEERGILAARARDVQHMVRPIIYADAMKDRAAAALSRMFQSYRNLGVKDAKTAAQMTASYLSAFMDMPQFAIEEACEDFRLGKVTKYYLVDNRWGEHDPAFCPSESVLALIVREKARYFVEELEMLKKILAAKPAMALIASERTPEEQKKAEAQIASAKEQLAAWQVEILAAETADRERAAKVSKEFNERAILADYKARGLKPVYSKTGVLISPSLLKTMGHTLIKSDDQFHAEQADSEARLP